MVKGKWSGEYFGIRPYVDGDSMKLIHWKLTGKTDEYMVKEVEVPMMRMPLIFLETRGQKSLDAAMIDGLLEAFFLFHSIWHRKDRSIVFVGGIKDRWMEFLQCGKCNAVGRSICSCFSQCIFSQGSATITSFEEERKEAFSEVIYITDYWNEQKDIVADWNMTLLLERQEAREKRGEAFVPYIFAAETLGQDIDRILTAYRSTHYGA